VINISNPRPLPIPGNFQEMVNFDFLLGCQIYTNRVAVEIVPEFISVYGTDDKSKAFEHL
jgi:hypothetical protein